MPAIELVNATTGVTTRSVAALEGPVSTVTGTARVNIDGRTMAVDAALENAYALTASGLGIVPLTVPAVTDRPQVPPTGVVNVATLRPRRHRTDWFPSSARISPVRRRLALHRCR